MGAMGDEGDEAAEEDAGGDDVETSVGAAGVVLEIANKVGADEAGEIADGVDEADADGGRGAAEEFAGKRPPIKQKRRVLARMAG